MPPQTTRAKLRGDFIKRAQEKRRDFTVDWVHLKLNDQAQRTVLCKDPYRSVDERGREAHLLDVSAVASERAAMRKPSATRKPSDTRKPGDTRKPRERISFEDMAARRAERLVNLVICLLSTRQYLPAERIRDAVPGYETGDGNPSTDEAFKTHVRAGQSGVARPRNSPGDGAQQPLRQRGTATASAVATTSFPAIEFDAAEAAAVGLAARLWQSATLGESAPLGAAQSCAPPAPTCRPVVPRVRCPTSTPATAACPLCSRRPGSRGRCALTT